MVESNNEIQIDGARSYQGFDVYTLKNKELMFDKPSF